MRLLAVISLVVIGLGATSRAADTKPRVTLELLTRQGLPLTASQQWYKVLTGLGISGLQIHSGGPRDEVSISQRGTKTAPEYKVVGILAADNVLYLPGGKFKLGDTGRLRTWLDKLGDQGAAGVTEPPSAFGLTAKQLEQINGDLKRPVTFSTLNMAAAEAVRQIGGTLKFVVEADAAAERELAGVKVSEELRGVSSGTALAAILRPAGLVLAPQRPRGGELQYRIGKPRAGSESWPVGWKPHGKPNEVLADLFEFLNVEISDTPVSEVVEAVQGRLKVPVLYDHNALALHGIDPAAVKAEMPEKRMTYSQTLHKVLWQARLKYELRVDEADKPLLWISTVKPVP